MNSIERVRAAFDHAEVDRVPIFEQGIACSVASQILGRPAHTGSSSLWRAEAEAWMKGEQAHDEFVQQVEDDVFEVYEKLRMDAIKLPWRRSQKPTAKLDDYTYVYGDPDGDYYEIMRYDPASDSCGIEPRWRKPPEPEDAVEQAKREIAAFEANPSVSEAALAHLVRLRERAGERFEVFGSSGIRAPLQKHWLEALALYPDVMRDYLDMQAERNVLMLEAQAKLGFKIIWGGGDFADNHGPTYSPRTFREVTLPAIQKMTAACDRLGLKYVFRTDGNLWPVADDFFVASGIHGYGEIDIDAGMDLRKVRERYPKVTLWGGLSCGKLLRLGSPDEVAAETRDILHAVGLRGLLFGSSNILLQGTPAENVYAYVETVMSCRVS